MTSGETIFLCFAIGAFLAFAGVLAYCSMDSSGDPDT